MSTLKILITRPDNTTCRSSSRSSLTNAGTLIIAFLRHDQMLEGWNAVHEARMGRNDNAVDVDTLP